LFPYSDDDGYPLTIAIPLRHSLVFRLAAVFFGFVVTGSLGVVAWLDYEETQQSQAAFAAVARSNAHFVRSQHLPHSERTASALGEVLGMEAYFLRGSEIADAIPDPRPRLLTREGAALRDAASFAPGEVRSRDGGEAVRLPLNSEWSVLLFRTKPAAGEFWKPHTFAVLGAFWLLSLALAWALAGGIVRPLRSLAQRLPRIADENAAPPPEAARPDEIGQLARAYLNTRTALADERRARQQAERLATLGRMATGLAHEINNPVAAIKLHAQLIEAGIAELPAPGSRSGDGTDSLAIILAENAKIEALVNQWMFLARPQPPQTSPCDPAELIADALRTHAPAAAHAGVKLVNETQPGIRIAADARRLGQAIGNVIVNAIQAMSAEGGTLTIQSSRSNAADSPTPKAEDAAGARHEGSAPPDTQRSTLNLHFTDTGPGFSAAALARHAELFFSEKEGGMGIGLSVTAEILRAHGGDLRVENSVHGATVTFLLPLATDGKSEIQNRKS
jgi:signal transduction histidine kinase